VNTEYITVMFGANDGNAEEPVTVLLHFDHSEPAFQFVVAADGWVDGFPLPKLYKIRRAISRIAAIVGGAV
jgi:hypothetical protein